MCKYLDTFRKRSQKPSISFILSSHSPVGSSSAGENTAHLFKRMTHLRATQTDVLSSGLTSGDVDKSPR